MDPNNIINHLITTLTKISTKEVLLDKPPQPQMGPKYINLIVNILNLICA